MSRKSVTEERVKSLLRDNKYAYYSLASTDIMIAVSYFTTLMPRLLLINNENTVCLRGTIPVMFRNREYHFPIRIELNKSHPILAPICYVTPTDDMSIHPRHKHVDTKGFVYLPYLTQWSSQQGSNLKHLIEIMSQAFSQLPPLYRKKKPIIQQQQIQQQQKRAYNRKKSYVMNNPEQQIIPPQYQNMTNNYNQPSHNLYQSENAFSYSQPQQLQQPQLKSSNYRTPIPPPTSTKNTNSRRRTPIPLPSSYSSSSSSSSSQFNPHPGFRPDGFHQPTQQPQPIQQQSSQVVSPPKYTGYNPTPYYPSQHHQQQQRRPRKKQQQQPAINQYNQYVGEVHYNENNRNQQQQQQLQHQQYQIQQKNLRRVQQQQQQQQVEDIIQDDNDKIIILRKIEKMNSFPPPLDLVRRIVKKNFTINEHELKNIQKGYFFERSWNWIHLAVIFNRLPLLRILVEKHRIDINLKTKDGKENSCLHLSCLFDSDLELVMYLLDHGIFENICSIL